jgi:hypothetical protein
VTTSSMVGRSEPGCDLCPSLSFKDVHHPGWGGGRTEPELYLPRGFVGHLLPQHSGERALTDLAGGSDFDNAGLVGGERRQLQRVGLAGSGSAPGAPSAARAVVAPRAPEDRPRRRALLGRRSCSWAVLPLLRHGASAQRSVLARPGGSEWGSAGGQVDTAVGAEVVAAGEVGFSADEPVSASRGPTSGSLALISGSRPLSGDANESLPVAASVLGPWLLLWRLLASRPESVVPQALQCGGCSYPREWNRSSVCNGTLSAGVLFIVAVGA